MRCLGLDQFFDQRGLLSAPEGAKPTRIAVLNLTNVVGEWRLAVKLAADLSGAASGEHAVTRDLVTGARQRGGGSGGHWYDASDSDGGSGDSDVEHIGTRRVGHGGGDEGAGGPTEQQRDTTFWEPGDVLKVVRCGKRSFTLLKLPCSHLAVDVSAGVMGRAKLVADSASPALLALRLGVPPKHARDSVVREAVLQEVPWLKSAPSVDEKNQWLDEAVPALVVGENSAGGGLFSSLEAVSDAASHVRRVALRLFGGEEQFTADLAKAVDELCRACALSKSGQSSSPGSVGTASPTDVVRAWDEARRVHRTSWAKSNNVEFDDSMSFFRQLKQHLKQLQRNSPAEGGAGRHSGGGGHSTHGRGQGWDSRPVQGVSHASAEAAAARSASGHGWKGRQRKRGSYGGGGLGRGAHHGGGSSGVYTPQAPAGALAPVSAHQVHVARSRGGSAGHGAGGPYPASTGRGGAFVA